MIEDDIERLKAEHAAVFGPDACPTWVKESLARYVDHGIQPGDCLRAVLCNDLREAFARADVETARSMAAIVAYVYNEVATAACGSERRVDEWIDAHAYKLAPIVVTAP